VADPGTGEFGDRETAAALVADDHGLVRFYVPPADRWQEISRRTTGLGEYLIASLLCFCNRS
jgi:type I restriction enzyme M protein